MGLLLASVLAAVAVQASGTPRLASEVEVREAIVTCVRERMGEAAEVIFEGLRVRQFQPAEAIVATPDAAGRVGGPVRFILSAAGEGRPGPRVGSADVVLRVIAPHVRTARQVRRGDVLTAGDLERVTGDVGRVAIARLPSVETLVGAGARQTARAGTVLTADDVREVPLVRSGDEVTTLVRIGGVEARGRALAVADGRLGEDVRVLVNNRSLRGRVVGAGEVEVVR